MLTPNKIFCAVATILSLLLFENKTLLAQNYNDSLRLSLIQKSKNQKTGAWILLVGGSVLFLGGTAVAVTETTVASVEGLAYGEASTSPAGGILIVTGALSMLGSIPLFIASGNNHQKALRLSVGTQQIKLPVKGTWTYQYQPAVSLKISLGRKQIQ